MVFVFSGPKLTQKRFFKKSNDLPEPEVFMNLKRNTFED